MENNTAGTFTYTVTYDCPYRNICSDKGVKCETCANNPKRSYYRPVDPYYPNYPYTPYYPWDWQPWRIDYGPTCGATSEPHYIST